MKLKFLVPALALGLGASASGRAQDVQVNLPTQGGASAPAAQTTPAANFTDSQIAEQLGWFIGTQSGLAELGFTAEQTDAMVNGLRAAVNGQDSPHNVDQIRPAFEAFMQRKQNDYMGKLREKGTSEGAAFMSEMQKKTGVTVLPSGLAYEIEKQGEGVSPKPEDTVRVHYTGKLVNGTVFDSSVERGEPIDIKLNEVIPGWTEGLQKISKGGKMKLYIPPQLAYGEEGNRGIPPASTLVFDVELIDVNPTTALPSASPGMPDTAPGTPPDGAPKQ